MGNKTEISKEAFYRLVAVDAIVSDVSQQEGSCTTRFLEYGVVLDRVHNHTSQTLQYFIGDINA